MATKTQTDSHGFGRADAVQRYLKRYTGADTGHKRLLRNAFIAGWQAAGGCSDAEAMESRLKMLQNLREEERGY